MKVHSVYELNLDLLKEKGVKGMIIDLDNTLVGAKVPLASDELIEWLERVQTAGFKVVVVSNNNQRRVAKFADPLSLPFIFRARKPITRAFRKALIEMRIQSHEAVVIGDQLLTDILGGNRLGIATVLVEPISPSDEGFFTRINRQIEKLLWKQLRKRRLIPWEDI